MPLPKSEGPDRLQTPLLNMLVSMNTYCDMLSGGDVVALALTDHRIRTGLAGERGCARR